MSSQEEFAHLKLPLEDIVEATNNFADENLIGQGGFGKVYKGTLLLSGKRTNIAARRLHYDYGQGDLEFWNEISMIATLKHDNLVSFVGFCNEKGEKIIINKHEFNGSLDKYLSSPSLTWIQRLHICVGVARALNYIHCDEGHESSVIHRNIKSSKILLDENWKPKLSCFELSVTNTKARKHRLVLADIIGTIGYVDPTYEKTGFVTHKSDVYSFGVVLFEVLCGRRAFIPDERERDSCQWGKLEVVRKVDETVNPQKETRSGSPSNGTTYRFSYSSSSTGGHVTTPNMSRVDRYQRPLQKSTSTTSMEKNLSFVNGTPNSFSSCRTSSCELIKPPNLSSVDRNPWQIGSMAKNKQLLEISTSIGNIEKNQGLLWKPWRRSIFNTNEYDDPMPGYKAAVKHLNYSVSDGNLHPKGTSSIDRNDHYSRSQSAIASWKLSSTNKNPQHIDDRKKNHARTRRMFNTSKYDDLMPGYKAADNHSNYSISDSGIDRNDHDRPFLHYTSAVSPWKLSNRNLKRDIGNSEKRNGPLQKQRYWSYIDRNEHDDPLVRNKSVVKTSYFDTLIGFDSQPIRNKEKSPKPSQKPRSRSNMIDRNKHDGPLVHNKSSVKHSHSNRFSRDPQPLGIKGENQEKLRKPLSRSNSNRSDHDGQLVRNKSSVKPSAFNGLGKDPRPIGYKEKNKELLRKPWSRSRISRNEHDVSIFDLLNKLASTGCMEKRSPLVKVHVQPRKSNPTKQHHFKLHPLFTMKRLDQYSHIPNDELLAQLAKSHYDEENLDDIIDPDLWRQMDPESFRIFSETAYNCLKEKRAERPSIDQILRNLQKALDLQNKHENPDEHSVVAEKGDETASNHRKRGALEHIKIPLNDIELAINKFTARYLGSGAYGKVYKAELELPIEENTKGEVSKKWRTVAVKCIREDKHGKKGFDAEIELLTSCKHTNVVSLLGFCDEAPGMILVYEHASNGSLDNYLRSTNISTNLTWVQRLKIAIDIARGLNYLHTRAEDEQRIIHRDIKSGNILLGKSWVAKIADFGLSRFHHVNQQENTLYTNNLAGTKEYLCPEYMKTGRLKRAVDIYSFGVVLFEILSGRLANDLIYVAEDEYGIAHVARRYFKEKNINKMVDPRILEEVDELTSTLHKGPNQDSLRIYSEIAYRCVTITQDHHPTTKDILEELEKALSYQENNKDNLQMSFEEIKKATKNFSTDNCIGRGGFGKVFKGEVKHGDGSTTIVAKRLDRSQGQGEHHFLMELEILFEYKHENIIGLEGYCNEKNEKIIVYEYASKKSLDKHLSNVSLTWCQRLKICIDIVRGLAFLHGGALTKEMVIHRDIKSANILLNADWKAKISDFGLSAITAINQEVVSNLVGTMGYVDPQYEITGFFTEKSDIYSLGVVLFEILHGDLLVPTKDYDQQDVTRILEQIHGEGKLESIVFKEIQKQIDPKSLSTFRGIVSECLYFDRKKRPTAGHVLQQLEKSLELQEDYEIWGPKLPENYENILKLSKSPGIGYSTEKKKDLYNMFSKGILLQDDKWFSLGSNGERNEMISATTFSYKNRNPHNEWYTISESRFEKVAKMLDISNLMIEIETRTQFLSPNTLYGVNLVFKFCDSVNVSRNPMYVDLKYREGSKTLHAYFANRRDDGWMMTEFYRFLNRNEYVVFKFLLESLSPYYCREHDAIYVEGIEFRPIDNEQQLPAENEGICKRSKKYDFLKKFTYRGIKNKSMMFFTNSSINDEYSLTKVDGKKHLMLSAKAALYNSSDLKNFKLKPTADSRFQEAVELLSQLLLHINCKIERRKLSHSTEYVCYLVFKLSKNCDGLHSPVEVRDLLLKKDTMAGIVYFRNPAPWNMHDITRVPKQRKDGWMEVNLWKFNSNHQLQSDCVFVNLKLVSYEGSMSGLIVCGLDFRPM